MTRELSRLLKPRSIAVIGGGAWCRAVVAQCQKMGFEGKIWPVHPSAGTFSGLKVFPDVDALPAPPDAAFIGVNRAATIDIAGQLARGGAGGAVCFASGFLEAQAEDAQGVDHQAALLQAADDMPILGPNCYGFINFLDGALLWPDQHGGKRVERGVAIVTQSSNIAINLTMQARALPLAYVITAGNQAQCGLSDIGMAVLQDPRVTALGLHIEGIGDLRKFEALARYAQSLGKRIVAIKVGQSAQAQQATISHTASLAGRDAGAAALLRRLGIARVTDLPTFLETLKLLHVAGPLESNRIATISCSGGEASLAADTGTAAGLDFPPLGARQKTTLRDVLGPRVALANPLDYHTYIWRDVPAMTAAFAGMADPGIAITLLIVDFPRSDRCDPSDWDCVIEAVIAASQQTGARYGMVATLPELMPEHVADMLMAQGITPFCGLNEALMACAHAALPVESDVDPVHVAAPATAPVLLAEGDAKDLLAEHGLRCPVSRRCEGSAQAASAAEEIGFPVALKGAGIAHKTEAGAVRLNLTCGDDVAAAAAAMPVDSYLVEEMITDSIAELLIGVVHDPAHGFILTVGAGGTSAELLDDTVSLLVPARRDAILTAIGRLRMAPILAGYRGRPPAQMDRILDAVMAVQDFVLAHARGLQEVEINPLLCTRDDAIAADALLRRDVEKD
ncbi:acetate--CoA ligase family protein [Sulfitobacter sp. PR48]|uniref:acetate--CoA ligase family protein n=1 Tax=Sulfitobacter sp. PR48 TaxID=3028383 RepID=UPI00237B9F14|nr:acetate--CoA ligase family protein [Sulfitobacter sp. PR48]MDD9719524.1 acetate--CoA ligase family protein [Sulfitobacter sp. PR48]